MANKQKLNPVSRQAKELYEQVQFGEFNYAAKREQYDPLLFEFLKKIRGGKLFDIGCGSGFFLYIYLKQGFTKHDITALDLATNNVNALRKKGFKAIWGDALALPFKDNVAHGTVSHGVIHHTDNPEQAFSELVRITKPGGYIYLNVYNKWHPYFYLVHKATYPLRCIYYHHTKKIFNIVYPLTKIFFQPLAFLALGQFLDDKTGKAMLMDQVFTPRAHVFSKNDIKKYAARYNCTIEKFEYNRYYLMIATLIRPEK